MTAPIVITGKVVGAEQVEAHFARVPQTVRERMRIEVRTLGIMLQNKVRFDYLMGQSLHKRTGRLINSINEKYTETGDSMRSSVGTRVPYGRFWELGFVGTETVRAHIRRVKSRDVRGKIEGKRARLAQGITTVREHTREVNQPARPFLRPALDAMRPEIRERLGDVLRNL